LQIDSQAEICDARDKLAADKLSLFQLRRLQVLDFQQLSFGGDITISV